LSSLLKLFNYINKQKNFSTKFLIQTQINKMKENKTRKLKFIKKLLIILNRKETKLIFLFLYFIISTNNINKLTLLISMLINKVILQRLIIKYKVSPIKQIFIYLIVYKLVNLYVINFLLIHSDNTEYLILYNNIYIKGLNYLVENYGELIAYAVGVKLSSIYLKISPTEPTFFFYFGLGVGPSLDLTVHQESYVSPVDSNFKNYVLLTVEKVEDHINFLKDMVPFHHKHYKISKMTNMENNITVISGDAPTNINVVNIHSPLESGDLFFNVVNIFDIFYIIFLSILFCFYYYKINKID